MRIQRKVRVIAVAALALGAMTLSVAEHTAGEASPAICGLTKTAPTYKHVVVIVEENISYGGIIGSGFAPYINSLADQCGLATNYHNTTHSSLPNYLAMTSGMPFSALIPFASDCLPRRCTTSAPSIFNQTFAKSYEESMPSNCDRKNTGSYAPQHNPAVYYRGYSSCASNDVPFSKLLPDFSKRATAPSFAFVTPNPCSDMYECAIWQGDNWLKKNLTALLATPVYKSGNTVVVLTWDEGEPASVENCSTNTSDQGCHVATIVIAPSVKPGIKVSTLYNHYSVLRTAEQLLKLQYLGQAKSATSLVSGFNL